MTDVTELFLYEDCGDEDGSISLLQIVKKTPRGYRVTLWGDVDSKHCKTRFVMANACRQYAHTTKAAALGSYLQRKIRQVKILENRLDYAKRYIELAKETKQKGSM